VDEIVRKLGLRMGLNDPINVRNHLVSLHSLGSSSACSHAQKAKLGRQDAGFGAWKSDEPIRPLCAEGNVRVPLGDHAASWILSNDEMLSMKAKLVQNFPSLEVLLHC